MLYDVHKCDSIYELSNHGVSTVLTTIRVRAFSICHFHVIRIVLKEAIRLQLNISSWPTSNNENINYRIDIIGLILLIVTWIEI